MPRKRLSDDGLTPGQLAQREYHRQWRAAHAEQLRERRKRENLHLTPEQRRKRTEYARQYRERNREKIRAYNREYRKRNKEQQRGYEQRFFERKAAETMTTAPEVPPTVQADGANGDN